MNAHHNAPVRVPANYRRPTHKQQIAIQTTTDNPRHGVWASPRSPWVWLPRAFVGMSRLTSILKTTEA